ncbi:hypothetical protein SUGI_0411100 [Cryptomeria japonica]|nr:hypothetical protein SUGI_0411100 [Cryptomeria japonica]
MAPASAMRAVVASTPASALLAVCTASPGLGAASAGIGRGSTRPSSSFAAVVSATTSNAGADVDRPLLASTGDVAVNGLRGSLEARVGRRNTTICFSGSTIAARGQHGLPRVRGFVPVSSAISIKLCKAGVPWRGAS